GLQELAENSSIIEKRFHDKAGFGGIALDGQSPSSVGRRDTAVPLEQREIQPFRAPRPQVGSMRHKEKAQARLSGRGTEPAETKVAASSWRPRKHHRQPDLDSSAPAPQGAR